MFIAPQISSLISSEASFFHCSSPFIKLPFHLLSSWAAQPDVVCEQHTPRALLIDTPDQHIQCQTGRDSVRLPDAAHPVSVFFFYISKPLLLTRVQSYLLCRYILSTEMNTQCIPSACPSDIPSAALMKSSREVTVTSLTW